MKVTFFKNVFDKNAPHHVNVSTALGRIKEGRSKTTIDAVRSGNKDAKKKLPVVCFSGEFASRADDALFEHSSFIVLDFDHVDVAQAKSALATDAHVYSCWVSPSGDGLKALYESPILSDTATTSALCARTTSSTTQRSTSQASTSHALALSPTIQS